MSLFQNPAGADQRPGEMSSWKSGQTGLKPGPLFPLNPRLLFQKTEALEQYLFADYR
jgi:hypothetical protein